MPTKLKVDKSFQPCLAEAELYPNGIFEFNITRLLAFIESYAERFPIELIQLADILDYGGKEHLDEEAIRAADLSRPILLAEVSPGRFNVIDGHHRVAKARREAGIPSCDAASEAVGIRHNACWPAHPSFLACIDTQYDDVAVRQFVADLVLHGQHMPDFSAWEPVSSRRGWAGMRSMQLTM